MSAAVQRLPDWSLRLGALVAGRLDSPFAWGSNDCCLWAADAVEAVTGVDPAAGFRGSYDTALSAARTLQSLGGLVALCEQHLGPEITPAQGQPGDIGLVDEAPMGALVVCLGLHWMGSGTSGLRPVTTEKVSRAWRCHHG